jgi:hypothetical protein
MSVCGVDKGELRVAELGAPHQGPRGLRAPPFSVQRRTAIAAGDVHNALAVVLADALVDRARAFLGRAEGRGVFICLSAKKHSRARPSSLLRSLLPYACTWPEYTTLTLYSMKSDSNAACIFEPSVVCCVFELYHGAALEIGAGED